MDRLTILLPAHDSHKDIVALFQKSLNVFWPDCPYEIYWTNGEAELPNSPIKTIHNGTEAAFSKRVLKALSLVETEYVLLWIEDLIPTKQIQTDDIEKILDYMDAEKSSFCALWKKAHRHMKRDPKAPRMMKLDSNCPYGISMNCGIFRRRYFIDEIKDENWSVWELETSFLQLSASGGLERCVYFDGGIGDLVNLVFKGKLHPASVSKLRKSGIDLSGVSREQLPNKEVLRCGIIGLGGRVCPTPWRRTVKRIAGKLGIKTASEY